MLAAVLQMATWPQSSGAGVPRFEDYAVADIFREIPVHSATAGLVNQAPEHRWSSATERAGMFPARQTESPRHGWHSQAVFFGPRFRLRRRAIGNAGQTELLRFSREPSQPEVRLRLKCGLAASQRGRADHKTMVCPDRPQETMVCPRLSHLGPPGGDWAAQTASSLAAEASSSGGDWRRGRLSAASSSYTRASSTALEYQNPWP